jgi:hypothetical protein
MSDWSATLNYRLVIHTTLQYSLSFRVQSEFCSEMLHLGRWQSLGEDVSDHVICGAIDELDSTLFDDPADPVISHVNVLGSRVVLVVTYKRDGCLVV